MMGLLWLYLPFLCKPKGIWAGGFGQYTWGIKDFHKCWSGPLAKRRLCLGPTSVINCTPLSALSFWVSLFPRKRGYNRVGCHALLERTFPTPGMEPTSLTSPALADEVLSFPVSRERERVTRRGAAESGRVWQMLYFLPWLLYPKLVHF